MRNKTRILIMAAVLCFSGSVTAGAELLSDGDLLISSDEAVVLQEETAPVWTEETPEIPEETEAEPEEAAAEDLLSDGISETGLAADVFSDGEEAVAEDLPDGDEPELSAVGADPHWVWQNGVFTYYDNNGEAVPVNELGEPVKHNGYFRINGAYYALDKKGKPRTGLIYLNKIPYYFKPNSNPAGQMFMGGWQKFVLEKGDKWIFFKPASAGEDRGKGEVPGVARLVRIPRISNTFKCVLDHNNYIKKNSMVTVNGKVYITDSEGRVSKNRILRKGRYRYYVSSDGAVETWQNRWVKNSNTNNTYYYYGNVPGRVEEMRGFQAVYNSTTGKFLGWEFFNNNGNPLRNTYKGHRFFRDNGLMASGIVTVRGVTRFFEESTASSLKGEYVCGKMFSYKGNIYYANNAGVLLKEGWIRLNGSLRYFENYKMVVNGFRAYNGQYVYLDGEGRYTTGWITVNDAQGLVRYVNPYAPGFYTSTWASIGGLRYYFDASGYRKNDLTSMVGGPYYVRVDRVNCVATVYDSSGTIPVKSIRISPGAAGTPTPAGTYYLRRSARWQSLMGPSWGQYGTHVVGAGRGGIFFHSIPGSTPSIYNVPTYMYNMLGYPASHGCIRCCVADAKFIFDYCNGSRVTIFDGVYTRSEAFKGPLGRRPLVPKYGSADPTDPLA